MYCDYTDMDFYSKTMGLKKEPAAYSLKMWAADAAVTSSVNLQEWMK